MFISQLKAVGIGSALQTVDFTADDILYTSLPLYHSAGGGLGLYSILERGQFSAVCRGESFSNDCPDVCAFSVQYFFYYVIQIFGV